MKKLSIIALVACGLAIICGFGARTYVSSLLNSENIAAESAKILGSPLRLQKAPDFTFFPPAIQFENLHWDGKISSLSAEAVFPSGKIALEFWPLLRKKIIISDISLDKPELVLNLPPLEENAPVSGQQEKAFSRDSNPSLAINDLSLKNCFLTLNYDKTGSLLFTDLNLDIKNLYNHEEQQASAHFSLERHRGKTAVSLGSVEMTAGFSLSHQQLAIRKAVLAFSPGKGLPINPAFPVTANIEGMFDFATSGFKLAASQLEWPDASIAIRGEGSLPARSFSGYVTGTFTGRGRHDSQPESEEILKIESATRWIDQQINFSDISCVWPDGKGNGSLRIQLPEKGEAASIIGSFHGTRLVLPTGSEDSGKTNPSRQKSPDETDETGSFPWPDMELAADFDEVAIGAVQLKDVSLKLLGRNGSFSLKPLRAAWARGIIQGNASLPPAKNSISLNFSGKNIDSGEMLGQFGIGGIENGLTDIEGRLESTFPNNILANLAGKIQLSSQGATIEALKKIGHSLPFLQTTRFALPSEVDHMEAVCVADKGVIYCKPVILAAKNVKIESSVIITPAREEIDGNAVIKTLGLELPLIFSGPFDDISWHTGKGFFNELRKLVP